jgi:hypothetical protein
MFYDPDKYDLLPFVNVWDDDVGPEAKCSFFVPDFKNKVGYIDPNGNSLTEDAKEFELGKREILGVGAAYDQHIQEYPFTPSEAFLVSDMNDFPVKELKAQLTKILTNPALREMGQAVHLMKEEGKVIAKPDLEGALTPITRFPPDTKRLSGAVVVYEFPVNNPPKGLYKIGYDPYRQDQSTGVSLGSVFVYKSANDFSYTRDQIVAEYTGRPRTTDEFNRTVALLAEYYNSEVMHENEVTSVVGYFRRQKKLHLLASQPDRVISANIKNSKVARVYGIHMNVKLKDAGEKYIKQWLLTERDIDGDGKKILNLERIYNPALLEELIKYNRKEGNFDRVMALMMVMFAIQEEEEGKVHKRERKNSATSQLKDLMKSKFRSKQYEKYT